jgi:hypothetical protein
MIYAIQDDKDRTIIVAGDSIDEFDGFVNEVNGTSSIHHEDAYFTSPFDLLGDGFLRNFRRAVMIVEHSDAGARNAYADTAGFKIVMVQDGEFLHERMLNGGADSPFDPYAAEAGGRTVSEMHNLGNDDPWDKRTDEQREKDDQYRKLADEAKKQGKLTSDSFGSAKPEGSSVHVSDIRVSTNADGSINIDDVLARKYDVADDDGDDDEAENAELSIDDAAPGEEFFRVQMEEHDCDGLGVWAETLGLLVPNGGLAPYCLLYPAEGERHQGGWFIMRGEKAVNQLLGLLDFEGIDHAVEVVDATGAVLRPFQRNAALAEQIDPNGIIAIYHRVEMQDTDLNDMLDVIQTYVGDPATVLAARGQTKDYAWVVTNTKAQAETLADHFTTHLTSETDEMEVYGVNDMGERLVPKGIQIVEQVKEPEPPRHWNARAGEIAGMDEDATKAWRDGIKGDEFLFTGSYDGARFGCTVWIVSRSYFTEHETMYSGPLDIDHILPRDLKEVEPGMYRSEARSDWQQLVNDLAHRGFRQSMLLQIHLNNLT